MTDPTPVHFFDILSELPGPSKAWSPNTLKTRIALNYKAIPYTQTYITYPDIAPLCTSLLVPPHPDGTAHTPFTLPVIYHPSISSPTGAHALMDSLPIARYLEEKYPARPLFPSGHASYALAVAVDKLMCDVSTAVYTLIVPPIAQILDPRGKEFYIRTRSSSAMFGKPLEEIRPRDEETVRALVEKMKGEMRPVVQMLQGKSDKSGPFFEGGTPGYADFTCVAFLIWFRVADEELWGEIMGLGEGVVRGLWDAVYPWVEGQGEGRDWVV
ncbi:hypothetical protein BJX99DRAFT_257321 [Aspergillus californicus]